MNAYIRSKLEQIGVESPQLLFQLISDLCLEGLLQLPQSLLDLRRFLLEL